MSVTSCENPYFSWLATRLEAIAARVEAIATKGLRLANACGRPSKCPRGPPNPSTKSPEAPAPASTSKPAAPEARTRAATRKWFLS